MKRCQKCGRRVARVPEHWVRPVVSLNDVWVHVSRYGRIKRFVGHAPEVCDG